MTDSDASKTNDNLQESSLSGENDKLQHGRDYSADDETFDGESGIGTLNECDTVICSANREVGSSGARYQQSNESGTERKGGILKDPAKDMKEENDSGNFEPRASRRYTESDVKNTGYGSLKRDPVLRRHTYAASRPPNFEVDDRQPSGNSSRLTKTLSDVANHDVVDFGEGDTSFRTHDSNVSRRNSVAGDILRGIRDFLENSMYSENSDNPSGRSDKGKRHIIAEMRRRENQDHDLFFENGIRDSKPRKVSDNEVISTSEDEENLRQTRQGYMVLKRPTVAGYGREYNYGRTPSCDLNNSNETGPRISSLYKQFSAPKSANLKRRTIAGTACEDLRDVVLEGKYDRRSLQEVARSPEERRYLEDKRGPKPASENIRRSVDEAGGDDVQYSTIGLEYTRDEILDNDENILINHLPQESSGLRRHTVHSTRTSIPEPQTQRRNTVHSSQHENDVQFGTRRGIPEPQTPKHTLHNGRQVEYAQFHPRTSIPEPRMRRHTVQGDIQDNDVRFGTRANTLEPQMRRRTVQGNTQDNDVQFRTRANTLEPQMRRHTVQGNIRDNDVQFRTRASTPEPQTQRHTVHSDRHEMDAQFETRGGIPEPQMQGHTVRSSNQENVVQCGTTAGISEPQTRRHTVHSVRQEDDFRFGTRASIPEHLKNRRATHAGFVQGQEFITQDDGKGKILPNHLESPSVRRRNTNIDVGYQESELLNDTERPQDQTRQANYGTIVHLAQGRPLEHGGTVYNEEDQIELSFERNARPKGRSDSYDTYEDVYPFDDQKMGKYQVFNTVYETEKHRILPKPRSSSQYVLSDNELHIDQDDVSRGTSIIVENINPTNSVKIQTPRFTITRSGQAGNEIQHHGQNTLVYHASGTEPTIDNGKLSFQHEEVVTKEHTKDVNNGKIISNYLALRRSVSPLPDERTREGGPDQRSVCQKVIPPRNTPLKGQDKRGNNMKFNLSVIEEENDEEYHHELEMQSQKTLEDHSSTQQIGKQFRNTNRLKTASPTINQGSDENADTSRNGCFLENQDQCQQPEMSVISKPAEANNMNHTREVSMSSHSEPVQEGGCRCNSAGIFEQREPSHKPCHDVIANYNKKSGFVCENCCRNNSAVTADEETYHATGNEQSLKNNGEPCCRAVDSNGKSRACVHSHSKHGSLVEATNCEEAAFKEPQKEYRKSVGQHDFVNIATMRGHSVEMLKKTDERRGSIDKSSKSHCDGRDLRSHSTVDSSWLPCCELHRRYKLHHPTCCWHVTDNQCGECDVHKISKDVGSLQVTNHKSGITEYDAKISDDSRERSHSSECSEEETDQKLTDDMHESKYMGKNELKEACPQCGREIQEAGQKYESKTQEIKKFLTDAERRICDTSSERGEYITAHESSISEDEDDFNYIKLLSGEGMSSVHRKTAKKQRHRKPYKRKPRRKGSLERSRGSPIRLSPMKTAAYERMTKQNKEMSDYLAKLTDEKSELRTTLCHLELQISEYRDREANYLENMRRNKQEMESMLASERTRTAEECLTLHQRIEGQKREMNELEDKLHEREIEVDETKRSLQVMEDRLERNKVSAKRLQASESYVSHWTPARIQKLYARYIRAEKSRKSLVYQKRYLVLLLGGFRENETRTLAMIAKMGAFPSYHEPSSRFSPAFTKFRTAVRVIVATKRMQFLVAKSKKSIRQVMEQVDSKSSSGHRNSQSYTKPMYNDHQYDSYRPNYLHGMTHHRVPSRFATVGGDGLNGYSSQQGDITLDAKDNSFAEIYTENLDAAIPKHTDFRVYSAFDYKPSEMVTYGATANRTQIEQPTSELMNRLESRNVHSMPHSPPVRERPNSQASIHSSVRPPFVSYQTYPFEKEPSSRRDARTPLHFDSDLDQDLDRKIQTLHNLQQKLSLNRGTKERDR